MMPCVNKVKVSTLRMLLVGCIPLICFGCILDGRSAAADEPSVLKVVNWNVLYGFNHKKSISSHRNKCKLSVTIGAVYLTLRLE